MHHPASKKLTTQSILKKLSNGCFGLSYIASSALNQNSHANQYRLFCQQFFCEVLFCFEKEVPSFYRNYSLRNSRNAYIIC